MSMMTEDLLIPRYKVINDDTSANFNKGDVLIWDEELGSFLGDGISFTKDDLEKHPHLFKRLEWWEERTIEEFKNVKFVKVVKYRGYWREGDIVPVEYFDGGSLQRATPTGFVLKGNHYQPVFELLPATKEEHTSFVANGHSNTQTQKLADQS